MIKSTNSIIKFTIYILSYRSPILGYKSSQNSFIGQGRRPLWRHARSCSAVRHGLRFWWVFGVFFSWDKMGKMGIKHLDFTRFHLDFTRNTWISMLDLLYIDMWHISQLMEDIINVRCAKTTRFTRWCYLNEEKIRIKDGDFTSGNWGFWFGEKTPPKSVPTELHIEPEKETINFIHHKIWEKLGMKCVLKCGPRHCRFGLSKNSGPVMFVALINAKLMSVGSCRLLSCWLEHTNGY